MWYDIFIDTILCGASGYITNKYVIDMMFKKYSIFNKVRCGDSIINSKMQFVKNVSTMMEKDIINAQKISEKFVVHNFNEEFESFSKDFFDECICRDIKNLRLKDIPVFYDACCCGKDIAINILENNIGSILHSISDGVELSSIITEKQVNHISKNIIQNIILTIQNTRAADDIASEIFDAFCDVKINDIVTKSIANKMKNNLEKESLKFGDIIKQSMDDEIYGAVNRMLQQLDIPDILEQIQESILKKPLKNVVKLTTEEIRQAINENVADFVNSDNGEKAITNIYYDLKAYLSDSKVSLYDIYKKDYTNIINDIMQKRVNNVVYSVIQWIDSNNTDLNEVIKEAISEIIPGNAELRSKIFLTINEYYNSQKYNDSSIFKMLLEFANSGDNLEKISLFMTTEIRNYLKSQNIDQVVDILENKRIISPNKITDLILKYISDDNKTVLNHIIDSVMSKPVGEFISLDLVRIFNSKLKYIFIDYIKENTFYSKEIHANITKEVNEYIFDSFSCKIGELVSKEYVLDSVNDIKRLLTDDIKNNEEALTAKFNSIINNYISKSKISDIFDKLSESNQTAEVRVSENLSGLINKNFSKLIDDIGDTRISKVLSTVSHIPDIHDSLSGFMKDIVGESIATVTEGYISEVVGKHFDEIDNDSFVGYIKDSTFVDEKKLSVYGGIIGGALGLSASLVSVNLFSQALVSNTFSWQGAVFTSIVGLSTNFIAMNGFSTAHSKIGILAKIPLFKNCTEEFIKEKQAAFADYMAGVVEANLIDKNTVQDLVQSKSTQIKDNIHKTIVDNEYQRVYECFENNNQYMASNLSAFTRNILNKNKYSISEYIAKNIANIPIKLIINRNAVDSIMDEVGSKKDVILDQLFNYISEYMEDNISIMGCMPKDVTDDIKDEIALNVDEQFNKYIECLKNIVGIKKYYNKYNKPYNDFLNRPLIEVISQNGLDDIYSGLFNSIYDSMFTEDKLDKLCKRIHIVFNEHFNSNMTLESILNRKNKVLLIGMFYKYFKDIVVDLQNYLNLNKHAKIEKDIREKLVNRLNLKEKSAYNSVGADKVLFDIMNNLISVKLPLFFDRNFEQFYEISKGLIGDIFDRKLEDLSICIDEYKFEVLIKEFFVNDTKNPIIKNKGFLLFNQYMQKYNQTEFKKIAGHIYLDSVDHIFAKYGSEIAFFLKNFYNNTKKSKLAVLKEANSILGEASHKILDSVLIKKLFHKIDENDLLNMDKTIRQIIETNDLVYLNIKGLINNFYNYLEDMDMIDSILDIPELRLSIESTVGSAAADESLSLFINSLYSQIISNDLKLSAYVCITGNVKRYFTDLLVDGFYIAIKKNLSKIFQSISLDEITKEEILNLSPEKYQEIYKIFWKKNKKNAVWTGLAGAVIGANKYVGLGITALETIKNWIFRSKKF